MAHDINEPTSNPWASNVVLVCEQDGNLQVLSRFQTAELADKQG